MIEIEVDNFKEVIVIGGGTCGLAVCARLCEECPGSIYTEDEHQRFHWLRQRSQINLINRNVSSNTKYKPTKKYCQHKFKPNELLVLDEVSDSFLGQWDNQFKSCQIPYLRSPMFFHIDPSSIDGLYSFAFWNKREKELKEIENVVGKEYSKHQLKRQINKNKNKKEKSPAPIFSHDRTGLIDVNMRDWRDYYRPSTKLFHDACHDVIDRYKINNIVKKASVKKIEYTEIKIGNESGMGFLITTSDNIIYGSRVCVVATGHKGKLNYPIKPFTNTDLTKTCHTSHIFTNQVKFPPPLVKNITIVGGGLTSAQLAHVCVNSGIQVNLLLRGPIKIKHFDFQLDWVTKYKNLKKSSFYIRDSDEERYEMINDARQGGSINPEYHKLLLKHVKLGNLKLMKHTEIENSNWNERLSKWELKLNNSEEYLITDYIVFATGNTADINQLEFLKPIIENFPIKQVQGFPCLTDNLQWNDEVPLFMVGKNASLKVGPTSANLDGARIGAERIGWYIQDQRSLGNYEWDYKLSPSLENHSDITRVDLACKTNWYNLLEVEA